MARPSQETGGVGNDYIFDVWCHGGVVDHGVGFCSGYVDQDGNFILFVSSLV